MTEEPPDGGALPVTVALSEHEVRAVRAGRWVLVELGRVVEASGMRARSALVGVTRGRVVAWANACRHQPLPLDVTADPEWIAPGIRAAPMDDRRLYLLCHSHGALYRTSDGHCVSGPCEGQALAPLAVQDRGAEIALVLPRPEGEEA
jgi:nitrite reductase/ring-hydroxylating ferredoxin subunit